MLLGGVRGGLGGGGVSLTGVGKGNVSPKILEYNRYLFILMVGGFAGTTHTYRNVSLKESGEG